MCRSTIPALKNRPRVKVEKSVQHHVYETNHPGIKRDEREVNVKHRISVALWQAEFEFIPDEPWYANNTPRLGRHPFMCTGDASTFSLFVSRGCCLSSSPFRAARSCTNATTYIYIYYSISLPCRWICIYAHENMLKSFFLSQSTLRNCGCVFVVKIDIV